jgi:hypothetical protein
MALDVDEPWCHDRSACVNTLLRRGVSQHAGLSDSDDAIPMNPHVAICPWIAGAVNQATVLDDDVIRDTARIRRGRWYGASTGAGRQREEKRKPTG